MFKRIQQAFLPQSAGLVLAIAILQGCGSSDSGSVTDPEPKADASTDTGGCAKAEQCPASTDECKIPSCTAGTCGFAPVADGTKTASGQTAGDCQKRVCKGGTAQVSVDDTDVLSDNNPCTTDVCQNGQNAHSPTGGTCSANGGTLCGLPSGAQGGKCVQCNADTDCASPKVCDPTHASGLCVSPTCTDNQKNGDETSADCGGTCAPCENGKTCSVSKDCASGACVGNKCIACAKDTDCSVGNFCNTATSICTTVKTTGSACSSNSQCTTGFCADGLCCNTACTDTCNACSAAKKGQGADGECGSIVAGNDPDNECDQETEASCGKTGTCDGDKACALYGKTTVCLAASCASGTSQPAQNCDGAGVCVVQSPVGCGGLVCNSMGTECLQACSVDNDCITGDYCSALQCTPKLSNGTACTATNQCATGNCVDGMCCDTACQGTCNACSAAKKGQGPDGVCGPVVVNSDPDNECAQESEASCGKTGMCDGTGACALHSTSTTCVAASCTAGTAHPVRKCTGLGTCAEGAANSCGVYVCNSNGAECLTKCATDTDCASGNYCAGGECKSKGATGTPCANTNQCGSGYCVDSVCCDTACQGTCTACSAAKKGGGADGTCGTTAPATDPDNECSDQGAATCGTSGACNGQGACSVYANGTACNPISCTAGTLQPASTCNGSGTCVKPSTVSCGGTQCNAQGNACLSGCTTDSDCIAADYCTGGKCVTKVANGQVCSANNQCTSGACADGVCCNASCGGTCKACNIAGTVGTCSNIPNGQDPANECPGATSCNGSGACGLLANGTACSIASECSSGYCFGSPSVCKPNGCGNGVIGSGENCDDANSNSGDGCSSSCWVETDYSCSGTPSVCVYTSSCPKAIEGPHAISGHNWYLGIVNQSCTAVCAAKGLTYDEFTNTYAGSSGSKANCSAVSVAFGRQPDSSSYGWSCAAGWGCSYHKAFQTVTWCNSPATVESAGDTNSIICRLCSCK